MSILAVIRRSGYPVECSIKARAKKGQTVNSVPLKERLGKLAEGLREGGKAEELTSGLVRQAVKMAVEQLLEAEGC